MYEFLEGIPRRVRYTEEENHRLKVLGEQAKEKLERLKVELEGQEGEVSFQKLKQFAERLIVANRKLTEKIATLNGLAERQHLASVDQTVNGIIEEVT
jgi:ubiquitin